MPAEPRMTIDWMEGTRSQAPRSWSEPITLMSCMAREDMPGPGWRTILLWTTVSGAAARIRRAISGSRMSSEVAGLRSSMARLPRAMPASAPRRSWSTVPARSSSAPWVRSRCRSAEPSVAWTVRSTASRRSPGVEGRFAIPSGVFHTAFRSTRAEAHEHLTRVRRRVPLKHEPRPIHLRPAAELSERVLLPGDPHRALAVAQHLLDGPKMFNHSRGLWGYTGVAADGELLAIQSTGMGGPSAAIVVEELIALGARRLVRIGTCGALDSGLALGDLVAAESVLPADGTSVALGANGAVAPDAGLLARLVDAGARPGTIVSSDLFYDAREGEVRSWMDRGAVAVEMEAATIFLVAARRGVEAACVLGVSDVVGEERGLRAEPEQLEAIGLRVGEVGYAAVEVQR